MRYKYKEKYPILNNAIMRPAEMQAASKAYPVGYFIGSTERGDYQTINKVIPQIIECDSEVSYQNVYQKGISNKIWEYARSKAEEANSNPNSKMHKKTKFKNSPSALVVYVSDKNEVKRSRRKLFDCCGEVDMVNGRYYQMVHA